MWSDSNIFTMKGQGFTFRGQDVDISKRLDLFNNRSWQRLFRGVILELTGPRRGQSCIVRGELRDKAAGLVNHLSSDFENNNPNYDHNKFPNTPKDLSRKTQYRIPKSSNDKKMGSGHSKARKELLFRFQSQQSKNPKVNQQSNSSLEIRKSQSDNHHILVTEGVTINLSTKFQVEKPKKENEFYATNLSDQ